MRFSLAKYIIVFIIIHSGIKFSLLCTKQVWCTGFLFRFSECFYRIKRTVVSVCEMAHTLPESAQSGKMDMIIFLQNFY